MKQPRQNRDGLNRRQFFKTSTALAGTGLLSPWALAEMAPPPVPS